MNNFTFIKRANVANSSKNVDPAYRIPHPNYNDDAVNGMLGRPMGGVIDLAKYYTPSLTRRAKNRWNQPVAPLPSWIPEKSLVGYMGTAWEPLQRILRSGSGAISDVAKGSYRVMKNYGRTKPNAAGKNMQSKSINNHIGY